MTSTYQEMNQEDEENDNMGMGRSYECVFCKRGFTNAQALGGHMNIHRRDRARNNRRPSAVPPSLDQPKNDFSMQYGFLRGSSSHLPCNSPVMELSSSNNNNTNNTNNTNKNRTKYFSTSTSKRSTTRHQQQQQPALSLLDEKNHPYTNLGLSLGYGEEKRQHEDQEENHGLDLELRLGT